MKRFELVIDVARISIRTFLCALLIAFGIALTIGLTSFSTQNAYAHGNCGDSHHLTQTVVKPGKTSASIVSCAKTSCTVKWRAVQGATSYEIKCTPKSSGKVITKRIGSSIRRTTVTGLKSGVSYSVQVRACKSVNGTKYCGNWSSRCSAKTKSAVTHHSTNHTSCVYITNTGSKFHRSGCRSLRASKYSISRSSAISQGYSACKICRP